MTNRQYIEIEGLAKLLMTIDARHMDDIDILQNSFGNDFKNGCVLELVCGKTVDCISNGCLACIKSWLDDEYDGSYDLNIKED